MKKLIDYLKNFTLNDIYLIESNDPQFIALRELFYSLNANLNLNKYKNRATNLTNKNALNQNKYIKNKFEQLKVLFFFQSNLINALLSYQLSTKGEIYWKNYSCFFKKKFYFFFNLKDQNKKIFIFNYLKTPDYLLKKFFIEFLIKFNRRLLNQKIKRLKKSIECIRSCFSIFDNIFFFSKDLKKLNLKIANCLKQKETSKTIVFAIKIFIYSYRIVFNKKLFAPAGIMIPIDNRISQISSSVDFWKEVELKTKIPLIHIDSILWLNNTYKEFKSSS